MKEVEYQATAERQVPACWFLTAWPLPVLGTPNPVITQNTQGLTGSLSQHHFPVSSSGRCGMHVHAALLPSTVRLFPPKAKNRLPLVTLTWPVLIFILLFGPERKEEKNYLSRQLDTEQQAAWKKKKICGFEFKHDFLSRLRAH